MTVIRQIVHYSHEFLPAGVFGYQQGIVSPLCCIASNDNNYNHVRRFALVDKWSNRIGWLEYFQTFWPFIPYHRAQYASTSAAISTTGSIINVRRTSRRWRIGHLAQFTSNGRDVGTGSLACASQTLTGIRQ